jgi:hypothetical protein
MTLVVASGCTTVAPAFIGKPDVHGFVIVEGEAAITKLESRNGPDVTDVRYAEIQEVTLQSVEQPTRIAHGRVRSGYTWFSNLLPGTYRIRDIRVANERSDYTYRLPDDAIGDPEFTFTVGAGELRYLGYILIQQFQRKITQQSQTHEITNVVRFNVIHNKDEARVWENVYDLYAHTDWEPLILRRLELVK